jgi:hypothetical protein
MTKVILILFTVLTISSLLMTYRGTGLQGVKTHSAIKQVRSSHAGAWIGSSGGGFSSGK